VSEIQALGGADGAIVLAATPLACEQAFASLKRYGTLVLVGLPTDNIMRQSIFETVLKGITIVGSLVRTMVDLTETFDLHVAGRTTIVRESRQLEQATKAMFRVLHGEVAARPVFDLR
jgi:propanol-preferring alcohol dehydrogenase